jgi:hypothetical protein
MSTTNEQVESPSRFGERFTFIVLVTMLLVLGYLRFQVLPSQDQPEPLEFAFENPMLDARPDDKVLFFPSHLPTNQSCSVVRPEGVVLRPSQGPDQISYHEGLRQSLPYLACGIRGAQRGVDVCGGAESETVLYALNYFGMPMDTPVRIDSIRPRWMKWGDRELVVYHVIFERYGTLGGQWETFLAKEAPVAGLVKWTSLLPHKTEVHFRPVSQGVK